MRTRFFVFFTVIVFSFLLSSATVTAQAPVTAQNQNVYVVDYSNIYVVDQVKVFFGNGSGDLGSTAQMEAKYGDFTVHPPISCSVDGVRNTGWDCVNPNSPHRP